MRKNIFSIVLMLLFGYACATFYSKCTGNTLFDFGSSVLPQNEWHDALIGKWKFDVKFKSYQRISIFTGDVEYRQDGTFTRYLTHKWYTSQYSNEAAKITNDNLAIIAGGSLEGTWQVNADMTWTEKYKKCAISKSFTGERGNKDYNPCDYNFSKELTYGVVKTSDEVRTVKCFTKDKILIEGKDYSDEGTLSWELKRIK